MRLRFVLLSFPFALLAGCGIGTVDTHVAPAVSHFQGSVRGGEAPIVYAAVSFYETATTGVATKGVYVPATPTVELGHTFTDVNGNFSFSTPLHCQNSNDYVYAVAAGGNSGSYPGTLNPNLLELAAVGSCASFGGSTFVVLNEVSTVAAAYALRGFTSISGSYSTATVMPIAAGTPSISSGKATFTVPNSFSSGQPVTISGCTVITGATVNGNYYVDSVTPGTFTVATNGSGLMSGCSATATAVVSLPVVSVTSSATNFAPGGVGTTSVAAGLNHAFANAAMLATLGSANTVVPGSPTTTVLPTTMVNTLANVLQACVNSLGGTASSATANDGSVCGRLFSYTTDVSGSTQAVPATTLQAALNMARFPAQNVANIVGLVQPVAAFAPMTTSTPHDLSLAVRYGQGYGAPAGALNGLTVPVEVALDANDNVYLQNGAFNSQGYFGGNLIAFSNAGQLLYTTPGTTNTGLGGVAVDTYGNLFFSFIDGTLNAGTVQELVATTGDFEQTVDVSPYAYISFLTLNSNGDLFLFDYNDGGLHVWTRTGTGAGTFPAHSNTTLNGPSPDGTLVLGMGGTVFYPGYDPNSTHGYSLVGIPYTGTGASLYTAPAVSATGSASQYGVSAVAQDASGRVWSADGNALTPYTPVYNNGQLTGFTAGNLATLGSSTAFASLITDGAGSLWGSDTGAGTVTEYNAAAVHPVASTLNPCISNVQGACSVAALYPNQVNGDSAGSLWIVEDNSQTIIELIGSAAPVWPVLALQKPGVMP